MIEKDLIENYTVSCLEELPVAIKLNEVIDRINSIYENEPRLFDTPEGRRAAEWFASPDNFRSMQSMLENAEIRKRMLELIRHADEREAQK